MSEHYYSAHPVSEHDVRRVRVECMGKTLQFDTDAGVFSRDGLDTGTRTLIQALPPLFGRVLDLGCGWGAIGALVKQITPDIELVMADINERATELSNQNMRLNHLEAQVVQSDGFQNIEGTFKTIVTNPPIRTSKAVIYALFEESLRRLEESGALYIVIRKQQGAASALKFLREKQSAAEVIDRSAGFWVIKAEKPK